MNKHIEHRNYPDTCRIYTSIGQTQFNEEDASVLYEGECIKYGSSQMRKYVNGNVIKADFCVDIPHVVKGIFSGMRLDVEDSQGEFLDCEIVTAFADNVYGLGTTVFFNAAMN